MRNRCLRLGAPIRAWGSTYLQWRHLAAEKAKVNFRVKKGSHINESWGLCLGHDILPPGDPILHEKAFWWILGPIEFSSAFWFFTHLPLIEFSTFRKCKLLCLGRLLSKKAVGEVGRGKTFHGLFGG